MTFVPDLPHPLPLGAGSVPGSSVGGVVGSVVPGPGSGRDSKIVIS